MLQDPCQHALPKGNVGPFSRRFTTSVCICHTTNTVFKDRETDIYLACLLQAIRGMMEDISSGFRACKINKV